MASWEDSEYYDKGALALGTLGQEPTPQPSGEGEGDYLGRGRYRTALQNPHALDRLIGYTKAEVGGQGPEAQQAFIETTFNRGVARDQDLFRVLSGSYFPLETHVRGQRRISDADRAYYQPIIDRVLGGSNITNYATGNASGRVGFAGGPQTASFGGERYGIEGPDRNWWNKVSGPGPDQGALPMNAQLTASEMPEWAKSPYYGGGGETQAPTAAPSAPAAPTAERPEGASQAWFNSPYYGGAGEEEAQPQPMLQPAAEAAKKPPVEGAGSFMRGFVSGFSKENPEMLANFLEGMSYQAPETLQPTLQSMAGKVREYATVPEGYERAAKSWENISGVGDAVEWAKETMGSGIASTVPSLVGAGVGAGAGALTPIPGGTVAGGIVGAAAPSYAMNYGEVYDALKQAGVDPKTASGWAGVSAVPISALDFASLGKVAGIAGLGPLKKEVTRAFASRVARGIAEGSLTEGTTEGAQELLKNVTVDMAAGAQPGGVFRGVPEAAVGGALAGGPFGGVGGALARAKPTEGQPPPDNSGLPGNPTGSVEPDQIFDIPQTPYDVAIAGGVRTPGAVTPQATNEGEKIPVPVDTDTALFNNNTADKVELEVRAQEPSVLGPPPLFPGYTPVQYGETPIYYSQLLKTSEEKLPNRSSADQILATLNNSGVKKEEMTDMGLEQYLRSIQGPISKQQVLDYISENQVNIAETYSEDADTKYSDYLAPGPYLKYGELRINVPINRMVGPQGVVPQQTLEDFYGSHWGDEKNVLTHVQFTTRIDKAGNPTLHIEGLQSDWVQLGQKVGFLMDEDYVQIQKLEEDRALKRDQYERLMQQRRELIQEYARNSNAKRVLYDRQVQTGVPYDSVQMGALDRIGAQVDAVISKLTSQMVSLRDEIDASGAAIRGFRESPKGVVKPSAPPIQTKYVEMALRRMYKWAADHGYARMSVANPELAIKYNTGARGDLMRVSDRIVSGLNKFYGETLPSRLKDLARKYGGVVEKQLINLGHKYPQYEIRPAILAPNEAATYQVWSGGRPMADFQSESEAQAWVDNSYKMIGGPEGPSEAKRLAGQPEFTEVLGVTIPPTARTKVQQIVVYQRTTAKRGPAATVQIDTQGRNAATPEFLAAIQKAAALFNEYAKKFGFDNKVEFNVEWGPLHPGYPDSSGLATRYKDGTYKVQVRGDHFNNNILAFYSTMMHEIGHVVMWEKFDNLPGWMKTAIRGAYTLWKAGAKRGTYRNVLVTRSSAARNWIILNELPESDLSSNISAFSRKAQGYELSFDEWFADQVARWATTTEAAVNEVDKTFQGIGKAVRFVMEWMARKFGIDPRPTLIMQNWLNSVAYGLGPMGEQEYTNLDIRTQQQNQYYVGQEGDVNVPGVPQQQATGGGRNGLNQAFGGNVPPQMKAMAAHADRMNWFYKWFAGLLELAAKNPNFTPLLTYVERNRMMHNDEARVHDAGLRINKSWRSLGRSQSESLVNFFDDMTNMEYLTPQEKNRGVVRQPTPQEEAQLKLKVGLNARGNAVYQQVKSFFDTFLQLNRANAIQEAMKISDPVVRANKIDAINATIRKMQARPYFPFMRFGRYYVTVKNPNGTVIHFETFERKGLQSAARRQQKKVQELKALHPNDTVTNGILPESVQPFIGLPGPLLEHIKTKMNLTPGQMDALEQLQFELSPALSFKHHFQHKNFTPGYSRDFQRSFARYTFHGGRYYARVRHIDALRDLIREARKVEDNKAHKIADYMTEHLENLLDAKGDYGIFKGAIFFWTMGLMPASATLNMSQTPMVTFPFLASKFGGLGLGEARATKALIRAISQVTSTYRSRAYYDGKNVNSAWEMRAISYGIKTGRITETQAPELAGIAQGGNLIFGAGGNELQRWGNWVLEKSASFFELAEQFNRRVAYRATLELATNHPNAPVVQEALARYPLEYQELIGREGFTPAQARAILTANHVVEATQLVYARYARPKIFRGRMLGTIFVFHRFIQGMALLGINNPSYMWRNVLLMMLFAGMGGIPGYEDLKDLVQGVLRRMGYNIDAEVELRKLLIDYSNDEKFPADLVLHGLARRGYGLPALTDMLGSLVTGVPGRGFDATTSGKNVPWPQLDRSKAITQGPYLPIQIGKLIDPSADINDVIAEQSQRGLGAVFSVGFNMYKVLMDKDLDWSDMKRWEKALPRMLGATSKAYRTYSEGRERSGRPESGATVVNYDRRDTEQMMEVIALGLGYNNVRAASKWDEIIAQNEHIRYIDFQRDALLDQYDEARMGGDGAEIEKVKERIQEFNSSIAGTEDARKRITAESVMKSVQGRARERRARETGTPVQKSNVPIAKEMQRLFPETTIDVRRVQ